MYRGSERLQPGNVDIPLPCEIEDERRPICERLRLLAQRIDGHGLYQTAQSTRKLAEDLARAEEKMFKKLQGALQNKDTVNDYRFPARV